MHWPNNQPDRENERELKSKNPEPYKRLGAITLLCFYALFINIVKERQIILIELLMILEH